jgi:outer membrane protein assembly factor BamB
MWHLAESVLVDGDRVICTPGGKDAVFAALDKATGNTIWTTGGVDDNTSYCSAALATHGGRRLLLNNTAKYVVGADADTGALLWTFQHKTPWGIHAVTPLYKDGLVYYVGGEKAGGGVLELSPDGTSVTSKWASLDLDCLHYGIVLDNGYLYGTGEKNDYLMCVEMTTGKVAWSAKEVGQGATVYADGMLYVYEGPKAGIVDLVKADPAGFQRTGSFSVTEGNGKHWAHPAIANGRLYIRHGDALVAYNIGARE